jgi:hypothetical protein
LVCTIATGSIETDISFAYIRARMREICIRHHVGLVGPTPGHVAMCWHTGCHVSMTPHKSKRSTSQRIRRCHVFITRIQGPTTRANRLQTVWAPGTVIRGHISVTGRKLSAKHGGPRSVDPQVGRPHLEAVRLHLPRVVSPLDPKGIPMVLGLFSRSDSGL